MPANKDFKRLVRRRMSKTGESYTAARSRLAQKHAPPPPDFATLAGVSDAAVKARTGCTWEKWVWTLDQADASTWPHRDIAKHIHEKYRIPGWWAQTVTVGYERIKGLRAKGQRRGGGYDVSRSRTYGVPVAKLYRAFRDRRARGKWLPDAELTVRTATPEKSMRVTWSDRTSLHIYFTAKGKAKSQVAIQHVGLPDKAAAERMKRYWGDRLDALGAVLKP